MTNMDVYNLLVKIDKGYKPTAEESDILVNLRELSLSRIGITELPESVSMLKHLQTLDLSGTNIIALPNTVSMLIQLEELSIEGTRISELPELFGELMNLKILNLSYTLISELPDMIMNMPSIKKLYLISTPINNLPDSIANMSNLQMLFLDNTQIAKLPDTLADIQGLQIISLSNMYLNSLPNSLITGALPFYDDNDYAKHHWRGIFISNTTIEDVMNATLLQSQEVRKRLFGLGPKKLLSEVKIVFLGDGEVGKSYTINRILNGGKKETSDEYKTSITHGIRIEDYRPEGKKLLVHLWDFGGQEILHSMHCCFLTENTGYVVMVDTRKPGQTARARYWLQNVKSIAPHAPVILVLNLWDSREAIGDLDAPKLIGQFGNDLDITVVKCSAMYSDQEEFLELMGMIGDMAETVEQRMGSFAAEYIEIKNSLKKEYDKKPYISVEEFDKICRSHNVRESDDLADWFNELGICFSYRDKDRKTLTNYMLLQPEWLTNAIYAIIMEGVRYSQQGWISRPKIYDILNVSDKETGELYTRIKPNIAYTKAECNYIIDVAKSFNLVYEDNGALFFPALLQSNTPEEIVAIGYTKMPDMRYRLEYEFLPDTVIHQLMVECRKHAIKLETCWLYGLKASTIGGLSAIVQMIEDNKTLEIDVYGEGEIKTHIMFKTLQELLTKINGRLNMSCTDFILAPDGERFAIARLETERRLGNTQIIGSNGKVYKIDDFLGESLNPSPLPDALLVYTINDYRQKQPEIAKERGETICERIKKIFKKNKS